ncbi:substrate-binding periplasmic protein [Massilia sp. S19_KUP03_FR1]|uniref:substrate-binding periplasmic protein n=1 Tax=Massilia sp. S19_KUP03_FR1 TaxID=3025503 RepID=UPI002FCDCFF3
MGVGHGFLLAVMLWPGASAGADLPAAPAPVRLTILTEHAPPVGMLEDGHANGAGNVVGSGSDKVRELMARAGVAYSIELQPWKRAYTAALTRADHCVFSTTRLPEREALFKWIGPIDRTEWLLLGRADRHYALTTLEDARKLRIGTYNGDARDTFLRERGFNVDPAQDDLTNPQKLLLGRIDLWAASPRRGSMVLEQNGWTAKIVPVLSMKQVDLYLACHVSVPDALVARMNAAVEAMNRDGTMKKIDRKYDAWQAPKAK